MNTEILCGIAFVAAICVFALSVAWWSGVVVVLLGWLLIRRFPSF